MNTPEPFPMNATAQAALQARLGELKAGLATLEAPEAIEPALLAEFRRRNARAARPRLWWMPPLALAATVALVSWVVRAPFPAAPAPEPAPMAGADAGPFLALRPLERIALEPGATLVAAEFSPAMLADWGLPVAPERAGEPVRAQLLVSAEGEPLALRLLD